jgi:hypothetical protein
MAKKRNVWMCHLLEESGNKSAAKEENAKQNYFFLVYME